MEKKKHLQTKFIQFLLERYRDIPDLEEGEIEIPFSEEDEELPQLRKNKNLRPVEIQEEEEDEEDEVGEEDEDQEPTEDDIIIEGLLKQYQKLKKQYEGIKIRNRRRNSI